MELFSWCLDENCQGRKLDRPEIRAYGRDLDYVLDNCGPKQAIGKARAAGKKIICYMSLGSTDKERTEPGSYERAYDGVRTCGEMERYPKEHWIDYSQRHRGASIARVKKIIDRASQCCDAIEYDNTDPYEFPKKIYKGRLLRGDCTSKADMIGVMNEVCEYALRKGVSSFLKNGFEIAPEVSEGNCFAGAISEACDQTQADDGQVNCSKLDLLCRIQGKPCVNISYRDEDGKHNCATAKKYGYAESYLEGSSTSVGDKGTGHCSRRPDWNR